jgi:hypothetical protein
MVQMPVGLITYILLAIYCHDLHQEKVSGKRLKEISINIRNEMSVYDIVNETGVWIYQPPNLNMPRESPYGIVLTEEERGELSKRANKYTLPYFAVSRARMILLAAQALSNDEIFVL